MSKEKPKKIRLFIGSPLDFLPVEKETVQKLSEYFACPVKFTENSNIHLTWKFIGENAPDNLDEIKHIVEETIIKVSDVNINFDKFEIWHKGKIPSLLVLTGQDLNGNATKLHQKLDKKLEKLKISREKRKFLPHITVARFKIKEKPDEKFILPEWFLFNEIKAEFSELCLFQSIPDKNGTVYSPLKTFNLK